jgi:hypothetical protein
MSVEKLLVYLIWLQIANIIERENNITVKWITNWSDGERSGRRLIYL